MVWIVYAIVFFGTLIKRKVSHIYVANWFYAGFIITVAVLHIVNSMAVPVSLTKSYSIYAGAVDAMVQWWYGHNAVGFLLTAGFLGMSITLYLNKQVALYTLTVYRSFTFGRLYLYTFGLVLITFTTLHFQIGRKV